MNDFRESSRLVLKVGGSLLALPGSMRVLRDWLRATRVETQSRLFLVGGGEAVDALRRLAVANPLSVEASHWGAIQIMDAHAGLLSEWLTATPTERLPSGPGEFAFRPSHWMRSVEPSLPGEKLAVGWETTSDAIATRAAAAWGAPIVFVKHTMKTTYDSLHDLAAEGVLDQETPRIGGASLEFRCYGLAFPGLPT